MAVFQFSFYSTSLNRSTDITAVIPADGPVFPGMPVNTEPLKLLILLHGYSGAHYDWLRGTTIEQLASMHRIAIVCPSGENSFYVDDTIRGALYEQLLAVELPAFVRKTFQNISDKREDTFIGGLSMGGYGAIRNGLKHADKFGAILAFSSALITDGISMMPDEPQPAPAGMGGGMGMSPSYFIHTFGKPSGIKGSDVDPKALAKKLMDEGAEKPRLYMACGAEDFLIESNRDLHKYLTDIGYEHYYVEGSGTHSWEYWGEHITKSLDWVDGKL